MEVEIRFAANLPVEEPIREQIESVCNDCIREIARREGRIDDRFEVSVYFCGDDEIKELNSRFRGIDSATDVLSFPMVELDDDEGPPSEEEEELMLGDIVVSLETAERQAAAFGESLLEEVARLVSHGMLHLLNYDDDTPEHEEAMCEIQDDVVRKVLPH